MFAYLEGFQNNTSHTHYGRCPFLHQIERLDCIKKSCTNPEVEQKGLLRDNTDSDKVIFTDGSKHDTWLVINGMKDVYVWTFSFM